MLAGMKLSLGSNALRAAAAVCLMLGLLWLDRVAPAAGLWMLVGLSATLGFAHGALDVQLMQQYFARTSTVLLFGFAYLLMVLSLGGMLVAEPGIALCLLLLMSAWHFGEPYARWDDLPPAGIVLTRYVVGGGVVMLPALLSQHALTALLQPSPLQQAWEVWLGCAYAWLVLLVIWIVFFSARHFHAARYAWVELAGLLLLNLLFSPLMAFALYFGLYHAPLHIWRVWQSQPTHDKTAQQNGVIVIAVFALTLLLCAILWWWLGQKTVTYANHDMALQWLIIALTALTLPHLILVSLCGPLLAGSVKNH